VQLARELSKAGPRYIRDIWPSPVDGEAWKLIGSYAVFELALMRVVPGARFEALPTATGHV
jgi:hypothetical protein